MSRPRHSPPRRGAARRPCRHHWLAASRPQRDGFPAACRRCGATRTFPLLDDVPDFNEPLPAYQLPPWPHPLCDEADPSDAWASPPQRHWTVERSA